MEELTKKFTEKPAKRLSKSQEEDMPAFHMTVLTPIERRKLEKNGELPKDEARIACLLLSTILPNRRQQKRSPMPV